MTSVISGRLQTPQAAPATLIFNLPSSMINATKTEVRVQPFGQAVYSSAGQVAKFIIPRTDRSFANSETMYITGNCDLGGTFGTAGTDMNHVLGTYWSLFSRYIVSANGKSLETIEKPSELVNMLLNQTLNAAEKKGMANNMGFYNDTGLTGEQDITYQICQPINTGAASNVALGGNGKSFTFAIPVIGLLNAMKQLPMFVSDYTIELTINDMKNWLIGSTPAAKTALATITFGISNLELVFDQLALTPESFGLVMQSYPEKMYIKSSSYDFGSGTPFNVTAGAVDIPINNKRSSLKQVLLYFNQSSLIDRSYGGVNPNLADLVFITNGIQYPQRALKGNNPSELYNQVQKAWGSLYSGSHGGCMGKQEFCRRSTGNNLYYEAIVDTTPADILIGSNKFYLAIDTELVNYDSASLYSGIPMGVNSNFRINIADSSNPIKVCTPMYWMHFDSIIEYDLINGMINIIS